jgi:hypothetical protein
MTQVQSDYEPTISGGEGEGTFCYQNHGTSVDVSVGSQENKGHSFQQTSPMTFVYFPENVNNLSALLEKEEEEEEEKELPLSCPWQPIGGKNWQPVPSGGSIATSRFLYKYEIARIIQLRAQELELNAPPEIELQEGDDRNPITIAQREFYMQTPATNMIVDRYYPQRLKESPRAHTLWQTIFT